MPTTITELFEEQKINSIKQISWGTPFNATRAGVYVVSTSSDPGKHLGITDEPVFDEKQIDRWFTRFWR